MFKGIIMLYEILKKIDANNYKINLYNSRIELYNSFLKVDNKNSNFIENNNFIDYLNMVIADAEIMLCGNNFYILNKDTIENIEYMFEDIYDQKCTLFINQQDFNIIYIDRESEYIYGYLSGGDVYLIADSLLIFFDFIYQIQELIINKYHTNKCYIQENYQNFLTDVRNISNYKIHNIDFVIDFLYG